MRGHKFSVIGFSFKLGELLKEFLMVSENLNRNLHELRDLKRLAPDEFFKPPIKQAKNRR